MAALFSLKTPKEELTFVPFHLKRPIQQTPYTREKTLSRHIHDSIQMPTLLNLIYTFSEVQHLRSRHPSISTTTDAVAKLMMEFAKTPNTRQETLEQLNAMIVGPTPYPTTLDVFKSVHLPNVLIGWFQNVTNNVEKCLLLNIISFCFQCLDVPRVSFGSVWKTISESVVTSQGTATKKHLFVLLQIVDFICCLEGLEEPFLNYSYVQSPVVSASFENPLNFKFLLLGTSPAAYACGEKIINQKQDVKEFTSYLQTREFDSTSKSEDCRAFLSNCGASLKKLVGFLSNLIQTTSRAVSPKTAIDLSYFTDDSVDFKNAQNVDFLREKDLLFYLIWANVYVTQKLLWKSNFFDELIFRYFIFESMPSNLPSFCLQSTSSILKDLEKIEPPIQLYASKVENANPIFPILDVAYGIAFHLTGNLIGYSPEKVQQFATDKVIKNILNFAETSGSRIITSEAAYALSKFARWLPLSSTQSNPKLISFIFNNLEEFELFEKYSAESKTDLIPKVTEKQLLEDLKKHCANIHVNIL